MNMTIVFGARIRSKNRSVFISKITDSGAAGRVKIALHSVVVWEDRGGGTNLSSHVTDSSHTGARE
jgi:hypothetical protein